jgi:hypothetical protein
MSLVAGGAEALDALYWRAEILQALYWMRGEGLASEVESATLAEFLAADAATVAAQLDRLATEGFLSASASSPIRYQLTPLGVAEGGRSFRDEFAELTRPAHYECGAGCWCHDPEHVGEPCPNEPKPAPPEPEPEPPRLEETQRGA